MPVLYFQRVPLGHGPRHLVEAVAAALGTGRRAGEREGGMEGGGSVAAPAAEGSGGAGAEPLQK